MSNLDPDMNKAKKIAIIGAGPIGLSAIKSCKEVGFEPVCFEKNDDLGGLWKYREDDTECSASVMKSTIMNGGKEMSAFSDFPPPKEFPNFLHHSQMYDYLLSYAKHFDLIKHIRYNMEVIKVEQSKDHDITGRWIVSAKSLQTEAVSEEFDAVMVCIGHHMYPKLPSFPGQENFNGTIKHSQRVKNCEQFSGKRVVVVGIGSSGVDVAVESSLYANQVYISTRTGSWIYTRLGKRGWPYDVTFNTRRNSFIRSFLSYNYVCDSIENELNKNFDHEVYNVKPKHRVLSAHPTISDQFPSCVLSGRIIVKGDIQRFEKNGVVFAGEDKITEADCVILATGYLIKYPFLGDIMHVEENEIDLYKYAIPLNLKHPTLAIIGLLQASGPFFSVGEMQSRWFMQLLIGNIKLPSTASMLNEISITKAYNAKRFVKSTRHTIQADWIKLMDELSSQIGAKPNMFKMAIVDPKLFLACFNGPCLPYQYRLQGPYTWNDARKVILTYEDRVFAPLNSDGIKILKTETNIFRKIWLFLIFFSCVVFARQLFEFDKLF